MHFYLSDRVGVPVSKINEWLVTYYWSFGGNDFGKEWLNEKLNRADRRRKIQKAMKDFLK